MEDKKRDEDTSVPTDTTTNETISEAVSETTPVSVEANENSVVEKEIETKPKKSSSRTTYILSAIVIIVVALALIFVLERNHRINTGLFSGIIASMEAKVPVAKVNGVVIPNSELSIGVKQAIEIAKQQNREIDTTDPEVMAELRTQTIDTLVNGELLRQVAIEKGLSTTTEAIDARYNVISEGLGGEEGLKAKMTEFGITEANLRRDIENDILIQSLFEVVLDKAASEVSEEEVSEFYNQIPTSGQEIPPLEQISEQIAEQIRNSKEQQQVGAYIDEIRKEANIEILI